jgi:ketosteroid isomerase-like protein
MKWLDGAALALLSAGLVACGQSVDTAREEAAVRTVWDEAAAAFMAKDWNRYADVWAQEPFLQVIHPGQRDWIRGWDVFQERYQAIIASDVQWEFETRRFDVQISSAGDVAWATIETVLTLNGTASTAWQVSVFQKVQGRWKVVLGFSASVPSDSTGTRG